jgi:hypothetical protein
VEIYTIGFTQSTAEHFFGRLAKAGVRRLLDVRLNSRSQLAGFAKAQNLDAIATLVTAGLGGEWNTDEADELDRVVASRQDIVAKNVKDTTLLAAEQAGASGFSAKALAQQVVGEAASGVLASAIVAGLTSLH